MALDLHAQQVNCWLCRTLRSGLSGPMWTLGPPPPTPASGTFTSWSRKSGANITLFFRRMAFLQLSYVEHVGASHCSLGMVINSSHALLLAGTW